MYRYCLLLIVFVTLAVPGPTVLTAQTPLLHAYVPNNGSGTVSVVDLSNNTIIATIPVGANPRFGVITPDNSRVYVPTGSSGTVSVIDTSSNTVVDTINVGGVAENAAIRPDGTRVYVTTMYPHTVKVIDTLTNLVVTTIESASLQYPQPIAITPDGSRAYVGCGNDLAVIDTSSNTVVSTVLSVGNNLLHVAISPNGAKAYVSATYSNYVAVIDTTTITVVARIPTALYPTGLAFTPSGEYLYISESAHDTVKVIDTRTYAEVADFSVGSGPTGISFSPDGTRVYVTNGGWSQVQIFDTGTYQLIGQIEVGLYPVAFIMTHAIYTAFSDGFEGTILDPFWEVYLQEYGSVGLSSTIKHGGSQSLRFASIPEGQRWLQIGHQFSSLTKGYVSVWFYDSAPGQQSLYSFLHIEDSNLTYPNNRFMVGVEDWEPNFYAWDGYIYRDQVTSIPRTLGWHKFEIAVDIGAVDIFVDGVQVAHVEGDFSFNKVFLEEFGPYWRPDATFYFDDFSFSRNLPSPMNHPPVANICPVMQPIIVGSAGTAAVQFDGSSSYDPDNDPLTYVWNGAFGTVSGSMPTITLPAGTYTITLTVNDGRGGTSATSTSFTILTAVQAIDSLSTTVVSYNLAQGVSNQLDAKLENAKAAMTAANSGNRQDAINKLQAFINAVEAQRGTRLTDQQADSLIAMALVILASI